MWKLFNKLFDWQYAIISFSGGESYIRRVYISEETGVYWVKANDTFYFLQDDGYAICRGAFGGHIQYVPLTFKFNNGESQT